VEIESSQSSEPESDTRPFSGVENYKGLDPERRKPISAAASRQMVHALRLHQTELEQQNEELRCTQNELVRTRAQYVDLYDFAPLGYCTMGETEHIAEANLTACVLLGVERANLIGRSIQQFIFPPDQDIYYLQRRQLLETGLPQYCEVRLVTPQGSHYWAGLQSTSTLGPGQQVFQRLALIDVDKRRAAEDRLRVSDLALRAVSQGVLITTPELRVVFANQAFLSMTGYAEAELLGGDCIRFNGPATDTSTLELFLGAIKKKRPFSCELVNYRKDGSSFWNALSVSPVFDPQGMLTNFISVNTDIDQRKRLDKMLQDKFFELRHATEVAEKANLAKSDFLSSMSHELRSPLNSILGFAQLLEAGIPSPNPVQQRNIDMILRGGWYLLTLINEILDLALIESGKLAMSLEPLSLGQVLVDCQAMVEPQAELKGIKVSFPSTTSPFLVIADPIRLKQVIVNLLSNAIKYNRVNGTVDLTVSVDPQKKIRIYVQDTGVGLSPEKVAQLFQPFNRLGQEESTIEGTGIGLVVTKRLAELMGGSVGVQSEFGVGSKFWVELSAAQETHLAKDTYPEHAVLAPMSRQPDKTVFTVLYVEDNHANVELMERILADRPNIRLLLAFDGAQGIELARQHRPHVILMDIDLPRISGFEAVKALREDPTTCHIPVLAVSANAMPLDVVKGLSAGFFRYLTKPLKINEFLDVLDMALLFSLKTNPSTNE
jgi:PAS domain S-box-containing protein